MLRKIYNISSCYGTALLNTHLTSVKSRLISSNSSITLTPQSGVSGNKFQHKIYKVDSILLNKETITQYLNQFIKDIKLKKNQYIDLIIKVKFEDLQIKTLLTKESIDKSVLEDYIKHLVDKIGLLSEGYTTSKVIEIDFFHLLVNSELPKESKFKVNNKVEKNYQLFYRNRLPIAYSIEEYGTILSKSNGVYFIASGKAQIMLTKVDNIIHAKYFKLNKLLFEWTDEIIDTNYLIRKIGKSTYHFKDYDLDLLQIDKSFILVEKTKVNKTFKNNVITMDFETILIDNVHTPYLLCMFNGKYAKSYYINDFINTKLTKKDKINISKDSDLDLNVLKMINAALIDLKNVKNVNIYFHNLSKFDLTF